MKYNTENVFDIIGNYPIVDQFDVLPTSLMQGNTYDNYVTGSMLTEFKINSKRIYLEGKRGLRISRIGVGLDETPESKTTGTTTSYELQRWSERCGTLRTVRIFSDIERFYDSMTPNLTKTIKRLGGSINKAVLPNTGIILITAVPATVYPGEVYGLTQSFPFEPKFDKISRVKRIKEQLYTTSTIIPEKVNRLLIQEVDAGTTVTADWAADVSGLKNFREADLAKILFGFGDRFNTTLVGGNTRGRKNITDAIWKQSSPLELVGPIVRGWRYGLISATPHYTSVVFRRDRFGQFRDMLEQRLDSYIKLDQDYTPLKSFDSEEGPATPPQSINIYPGKNMSQVPAVDVRFVSKTLENNKLVYKNVKPESTDSSNLSTYMTSSMPFFDDNISRNRTPANPNLLNSATIFQLGSDIFGNLLAQ